MNQLETTAPDQPPPTEQASAKRAGDVVAARPRTISRRMAMDVVGLGDIAAVLLTVLMPLSFMDDVAPGQAVSAAVVQAGAVKGILAHLIMRNLGHYKPDAQSATVLPFQTCGICVAVAVAFLATFAMGAPAAPGHSVVTGHLTSAAASIFVITCWRLLAQWSLHKMTALNIFQIRLAIWGHNTLGKEVRDAVRQQAGDIEFVGYFEHLSSSPNGTGLPAGPDWNADHLLRLALQYQIDRIIVAFPPDEIESATEIAKRLEHLPIDVHVVTHLAGAFGKRGGTHRVESIGTVGLLEIVRNPLSDWARLVKEAEDVVIGSLAVLAALPVMAIIALAIKIDSPGPIIFRQRRHGLNYQVIEVLKFRTMCVMEDGATVHQAREGDRRITRIGRCLRWSSLDELPQLFNVLSGEMSLIGPRPHAVAHDRQFGEHVERYGNRFRVKPGITGLAQIMGFRGLVDTRDKIEGRVRHDLLYIECWSPVLDAKILGLTLLRGFFHRHAV
jgi:Undecaprenyl-phosphate glucose phosphotransferase